MKHALPATLLAALCACSVTPAGGGSATIDVAGTAGTSGGTNTQPPAGTASDGGVMTSAAGSSSAGATAGGSASGAAGSGAMAGSGGAMAGEGGGGTSASSAGSGGGGSFATCDPASGKAVNVYMIGDSTMSVYASNLYPRMGWGQPLGDLFDAKCGSVVDKALSGRSSKSFFDEGAWTPIRAALKPGDYVLIQFGHNDEKSEDATRYTEPQTTYKQYLTTYVNDTKGKQANPILLTSINRNGWSGATVTNSHGLYPAAVRELATALRVPLIDLTALTKAYFERIGQAETAKLFLILAAGQYPNYPEGVTDNTHLQEAGARAIGRLAMADAYTQQLPLARLLKGAPVAPQRDATELGPNCIKRDDWHLWICPRTGTQNVSSIAMSPNAGVQVTMYDLAGNEAGTTGYANLEYPEAQITGPSELGWHHAFPAGVPAKLTIFAKQVPAGSFSLISFTLPPDVSCSIGEGGWSQAADLPVLLGSTTPAHVTAQNTCFVRIPPTSEQGDFSAAGLSVPNQTYFDWPGWSTVEIDTGCSGVAACASVASVLPALP